VISIVLLIFSPRLIRILIGWDGLGLTSYLLVLYYNNSTASSNSMLTAISNRVGDAAILVRLGFFLYINSFILSYNYVLDNEVLFIRVSLIILAAFTKRAQIPFSAWLPAAIVAPTPVSALVHSSTLVTAGLYLLIRFRQNLRIEVCQVLIIIGGVTILISSLSAIFEFDIKKIIALSTLSQLGIIITAIGLNNSISAFLHILTHAFFKALLFIGAGILIIKCKRQDIRIMGGVAFSLPYTSTLITIANLSLCGTPFLSGFYSKDLILEKTNIFYILWIYLVILTIRTISTVIYSFRWRIIIISDCNNFSCSMETKKEIPFFVIFIISITGLLAMIIGKILYIIILLTPQFTYFTTIKLKLSVGLICLAGGVMSYIFKNNIYTYRFVSYFFIKIWFIPTFNLFFTKMFFIKTNLIKETLDSGWWEGKKPIISLLNWTQQYTQTSFVNKISSALYLSIIWFIFICLCIIV